MIDQIEIRNSGPGDVRLIEELYPDAFPEEDLLPVVRDLLQEASGVLSLVAIEDNTLVGHVIFTSCNIDGKPGEVALLGPLAVASARHRQGLGSAIVGAGLQKLEDAGVTHVFVLGDPAYYGRFGFEADGGVEPPYPMPEEWRSAWQSLGLGDRKPPLNGKLCVPDPWRKKALWT